MTTATTDELREALLRASNAPDERALRDVVRACVQGLRDGEPDTAVVGATEELVALARHSSTVVRREMARGCDVFPEAVFDPVFAALSEDADGYVRENALRATRKRRVRTRAHDRREQEGQAAMELYAEIEKTHGKGARRLAMRATNAGIEYFVRRLYHEFARIAGPRDRSMGTLRVELEKLVPPRPALVAQVASLRDRFDYLDAIVRRAREYVTRVTPSFAEAPVREVVETSVGHLVERLGARAPQLDVTIEIDPHLRFDLDRHALLEALDNVLQNAVEAYVDPGVRMSISVRARSLQKGSRVELSIRDAGQGMSDDERAELFVRTGSRKPGGMGFGLLMVRKMVEEVHGGELSIESAPGAGATVRFLLPTRQVGR